MKRRDPMKRHKIEIEEQEEKPIQSNLGNSKLKERVK